MPRDTRRRRGKPPTTPGRPAKGPTLPPRRAAPQAPKVDSRQDGSRYFLGQDFVPDPTTPTDLQDRVRGAIMWSAYGDSAGMPFEGRAPLEIYRRNGGAWVTGLVKPGNNFSRYLDKGGWTDDTQLKIALMLAFLEGGSQWDMDLVARHHVRSADIGMRGWGGSTRESVMKLKRGTPWRQSGKKGGAGNGIPMKISPLALSYAVKYSADIKAGTFRYGELVSLARNIAIMTHRDTRAVLSGICHCILMIWAVNDVDPVDRWDDLMRLLRRVEDALPDMGESLTSRLEWIPGNLHRDVEYFAHLYRTGCFVLESYPFSVATYLLYRSNVVEGTLAAVNAGGDCDSTAAIVGDLCGAEAGLGTEDRTLELEQHDNLLGLADAFYYASTS